MKLVRYIGPADFNIVVNDMVKITTIHMNAFSHDIRTHIGLSRESFWCQVATINEDSTMLVMASNNCFNSDHEQESPICFGQFLTIDESNIKQHKKGLINGSEEEFNAAMAKAIETIEHMDVDKKILSQIQDMNKEELQEFLAQFEMSNTLWSTPRTTPRTTPQITQKNNKKNKNTKKKTAKN